MEKTQLLCTFAKKRYLDETVDSVKSAYETVNKIFILQNCSEINELYLTYNVEVSELKQKSFLRSTISVHRNKGTNTLYTINAINSIVVLLNDGVKDPAYKIDWENYRNTILVTNEEGLKQIKTKIFKILDTSY